jgi:orotate phosphoribosyltransferase-like protein
MTQEEAQSYLDRVNEKLADIAKDITEAGFHVDMEVGVGTNGLMVVKFVANEK